jgi:transcriptional regulator with XRE-family HTH domain
MFKMAGRGRNPVDILVGRNIRIHRLDQGLSQTELGKHIGVTFQQVQKYENGVNRVGSGRLFKIAGVLGVPVSTFFDGADTLEEKSLKSSPVAMLAEPYALRLLRAFSEISDSELRRSLVEMAEKFAAKLATSGRKHKDGENASPRARAHR